MNEIELIGKTPQEVKEALGGGIGWYIVDKIEGGNIAVWQYRFMDCASLSVWFRDGVVIKVFES